MARHTITELVDDLDGTTATQQIHLTLDGVHYEIDLTDEHAAQLRAVLEPWRQAARRLPASRPTPAQARARSRHFGLMRQWGAERGWKVPDQGRLPQDLQAAFYRAHRPERTSLR